MIPAPTLCQLEYLTPTGWASHGNFNLLYPERYIDRLAAQRKFGRVTILDAKLRPTGKVFVSDNLPDPAQLIPSRTVVPKLPDPDLLCSMCDAEHLPPYDGSCLL